jgi:hypothetical protein
MRELRTKGPRIRGLGNLHSPLLQVWKGCRYCRQPERQNPALLGMRGSNRKLGWDL